VSDAHSPGPAYVVGIDLGTTNTVVAYAPLQTADAGQAAVRDFPVVQTVAPHETAALPQMPSALYRASPAEVARDAARLPWDSASNSSDKSVDFTGAFARAQGAKVPGRVIVSAKSWLSVSGVDRASPILPWAASDDVEKLSPVDVQARILAHAQRAWDHAHADAPLAAQDVVVTIPASFDESARELTLAAAERAGLPHVRLLEEPQAALYAFLARHTRDPKDALSGVRLVLVVDVGGGTTDLTLVAVDHADGSKPPILSRIAVGEHFMLGGDNMDITLARHVEQQLAGAVGTLDAASWGALVESARAAKEILLGADAPAETSITLASRGKKLVGGSKSLPLTRVDVERLLVDGFFPRVAITDAPARKRTALTELGLPYAQDAAITRHLAEFLRRHVDAAREIGAPIVNGTPIPDALLLNGGVFRSAQLRARLLEVVTSWAGHAVPLLDARDTDAGAQLDLAVARGAAFSGLVRRGRGLRIGGGSARAYFVGIQQEGRERALCVVPKGQLEGERLKIDRTFRLLVDRPVGFALYSSTSSAARGGEIVDVTDALERMPPLSSVLPSEPELPVRVESFLSEVGTLELSLHVTEEALRRFKLAFSTRAERTDATVPPTGAAKAGEVPKLEGQHKRIEEGRELVAAFFGNKSKDVDKSKVKDLRRDLEKILGLRDTWSTGTNRELAGALLSGTKNRRRSMEHERAWFQNLGFTLRPGVGAPFDDWRMEQLWPIFDEGVQHVSEKPTWASWFILWRRVAGGLNAERQQRVWAYLKPWLLEQGTGKKGTGPTPHGQDEMVRLAAALERISAAEKAELGAFVLKKLGRGGITSVWPLGRIGARALLFGSAHDVVAPAVASEWIDRVLSLDVKSTEGAAYALAQMARVVGDRALDLDDKIRARVAERLDKSDAPKEWALMVRERVARTADDEAQAFGESLPPGLRV
jgi:molecular chaperone DnaK (HSP70)